jgi:hypothetical protein
MKIARRSTSPDGSKTERRKSPRFTVNVPIEVSWHRPDGTTEKRDATAKSVNAQGGLLHMEQYPEMGGRVTLVNLVSAETSEARVLATPSSREGVADGIMIELTVPSETFWGVTFVAKKANVELQKLENSLRSAGVDLRLLTEFREAVDYMRLISASAQDLRERQIQGRESQEVLELIGTERVRRATTLCHELNLDLDANKLGAESKGIKEFQQAMEQTSDRLKSLLKPREQRETTRILTPARR